MKFESLFKIDNKRKVREWKVFVEGNIVVVDHGVQGGARQEKRTACSSKNVGKLNETTPEDQAEKEAMSKWRKQLDKGYTLTIEEQTEKPFLPMLAHRYDKHKHKIEFPAYIQPKLNGIRCNIRIDKDLRVSSRRNKNFTTPLIHLLTGLEDLFKKYPNLVIDGELYSHTLSLQDISSGVKRDEPNDMSKKIELHVYDCLNTDKLNMSFKDRLTLLDEIASCSDGFIKVETVEVNNESDIFKHHANFLLQDYEGSIVRNSAGLYKVDGRSYDLLKVKEFIDEEFKIIDQKKDKNEECVFTCVTKNGEFGVKIKGDREYRQGLLLENSRGKLLTVRYSELTPDGIPFHPVGLCIRDYE